MHNSQVPNKLVILVRYWYSVRWGAATSIENRLECGVLPGRLTSPDLFNVYINGQPIFVNVKSRRIESRDIKL